MKSKVTTLNIRMTEKEKDLLRKRADVLGKNISSYARDVLLNFDNDVSQDNSKDNTNVLSEKDERIADLKNQINDYKNQIAQLHSIILVAQKDNQLLIEQTRKSWWQFWK